MCEQEENAALNKSRDPRMKYLARGQPSASNNCSNGVAGLLRADLPDTSEKRWQGTTAYYSEMPYHLPQDEVLSLQDDEYQGRQNHELSQPMLIGDMKKVPRVRRTRPVPWGPPWSAAWASPRTPKPPGQPESLIGKERFTPLSDAIVARLASRHLQWLDKEPKAAEVASQGETVSTRSPIRSATPVSQGSRQLRSATPVSMGSQQSRGTPRSRNTSGGFRRNSNSNCGRQSARPQSAAGMAIFDASRSPSSAGVITDGNFAIEREALRSITTPRGD